MGTDDYSKTISLEVREQGPHLLKIVCRCEGNPFLPYLIDIGCLKDKANDVRTKLSNFVDTFRQGNKVTNEFIGFIQKKYPDNDVQKRVHHILSETHIAKEIDNKLRFFFLDLLKSKNIPPELDSWINKVRDESISIGKSLDEIARAGYDFYMALFSAEDNTDNIANRVKEFLKVSKDPKIHFIVDRRIHIPWGLIHDEDIKALNPASEGYDINKYKNFWNLKYSLTTNYIRIPPVDKKPLEFKLLPLFNEETYNNILSTEVLEISEKKALDNLFSCFSYSHYKMPIFKKEDFFNLWQKISNLNSLIYIFCHANGTSLALGSGPTDLISTHDLRFGLKTNEPLDKNNVHFFFLNGCSTAIGHPSGGFLEVTGRSGFYGFIGTEVKVPDIFAFRFGSSFLRSFFRTGHEVCEIINGLRQKHWPLSLIYSIYCYPKLYSLKMSKIKYPELFDGKNYSHGEIGTNELKNF